MSDTAYLPSELVSQIFILATNGSRDDKSLAKLCQVCRQWNMIAQPRLYTRWAYHGEKHTIRSLWKFLCTMIRENGIADLVRYLDVRNWAFPREDPEADIDATEEELVLVQEAFRAAGMDGMGGCVMNHLRAGNRKPFMALLFTRLPKLSAMAAHLPSYDAFLGSVLNRALINHDGGPSMEAFQNLKELSVLSEWARPRWESPDIPHDLYKFNLVCWAPLFSLPRLEKLTICGLDVKDALRHCGRRAGTSPLRHLTLINHEHAIATALETQAILAVPKALVSLSFYQNHCNIVPPGVEDQVPITNAQLFYALGPHRQSLEYLDIYRDDLGTSPPMPYQNVSYFGSLREFDRFRNLCIQPMALLGGMPYKPRAPFRLRDTLPPSLESVTFYRNCSFGFMFFPDLVEQLREVLLGGNFPHLKSVIFEDVNELVRHFAPSFVSRPNQAVQEICQEAGVAFLEQNGRRFRKGGKQLPWVLRAGRMRRRRESKQDILPEDEDPSEEDSSARTLMP